MAVQDRAAELILGTGIDGAAEQAISERIMQETMVPEFRAGRYAMGAFRGAERAAVEILRISIALKAAETASSMCNRCDERSWAGRYAQP